MDWVFFRLVLVPGMVTRIGMLTEDPAHLRELMDWIDQLYLGEFCQKCQRRAVCPDPIA